MASPPFLPNELVPGDTDIVSQYPAAERTFRDIIEDWILFEHGTSGHHKFPVDTTANIAADTTFEQGSIVFDTTLNILKAVTSVGPIVFHPCGIEKNTRVMFQQTSAPLGYTKETNVLYDDALILNTINPVTTAGLNSASTKIGTTAFTIAQANLPNVTLTAASNGNHSHLYGITSGNIFAGGSSGPIPQAGLNNTATSTDGAHTHNVPLGGSGTAVSLDIKWFSTIIGIKS